MTTAMTDSALLVQLGLSQSVAAELLSDSSSLMEKYGSDMTVEKFLETLCKEHVTALQAYYDERVNTMQRECEQNIQQIKAQYAQ